MNTIVNLTSGTHLSKSMVWDSKIPCVRGNGVSSYYSACESSSVPIHFNYENFTYIVGKENIYRTCVCDNKQAITKAMAIDNWEVLPINDRDLKSLLKEENWETLNKKYTFLRRSPETIGQYEVLCFDREVTWHFGVVPVEEVTEAETILLREGKFLFTENHVFYKKNNEEWYKVWDDTIDSFQEYRVAQFKEEYCLFTCNNGICYAYEFSSENGLGEALEGLQEKIKANEIAHTSLEEAVDWLIENQVELTIDDSYAVGNCKPGTQQFIDKYFKGKEVLTINSKNKTFILKLANENPMFANVLKNKYLKA